MSFPISFPTVKNLNLFFLRFFVIVLYCKRTALDNVIEKKTQVPFKSKNWFCNKDTVKSVSQNNVIMLEQIGRSDASMTFWAFLCIPYTIEGCYNLRDNQCWFSISLQVSYTNKMASFSLSIQALYSVVELSSITLKLKPLFSFFQNKSIFKKQRLHIL